jgi:hypothetical protein
VWGRDEDASRSRAPDDIEHITLALDVFEVNQRRAITPDSMGDVGVEGRAEIGVAIPAATL